MAKKSLCLGFDLDGVIVDKPPLIPKVWLEYLFKGGGENNLYYRFPQSKMEQIIRKISHFYLFRPPLKKNIDFVKKLKKQGHRLYLISGRYSFLKKETANWLKERGLNGMFREIFLNLKNEQPYVFKERIIRQLNLDYYFEDDKKIAAYLQERQSGVSIIEVKRKKINFPDA